MASPLGGSDGPGPGPEAEAPLGARVLRQMAAFAGLRLGSSLLTLVTTIALSRLLDRRDFGAFAIGMFYVGLGHLLGDGGLAASLVRHRSEPTRLHLRVALTASVVLGTALGATYLLALPTIARLNQLRDDEVEVLRLLAVLFVLPAFRSIPYVKLERSLRFAVLGKIELGATVVRHATALGVFFIASAADATTSAWALAASQVALAVTQVALAYRAAPGFAGVGWDRSIFAELFSFGGKVQASNFFLYLKDKLAAGLLGPWLGPAAVGLFDWGLQYTKPSTDLVGGLSRFQFPLFSRLERGDPALARAVVVTLRTGLIVAAPFLAVLVVGAPFLIETVYGREWLPATPLTWTVSLHFLGSLLVMQLITLQQGQGYPGLALGVYAAWAAALWSLTAVAIALAIAGEGDLAFVLAAAGAAHTLATAGVAVYLLTWGSRHVGSRLARAVRVPLAAFVLALAAGGGVLSLGGPVGHPLLAAAAAVAAFFAALFGFEGPEVRTDLRTAWRILRRKRA